METREQILQNLRLDKNFYSHRTEELMTSTDIEINRIHLETMKISSEEETKFEIKDKLGR